VPVPQQPQWAAWLSEIAQADGVEHGALVALVDEEIVGVTRYDRTTPEEVEVALLIEDGWQKHGLGKPLVARLVNEARCHGVETFRAYIQSENWSALRLAGTLFATVQPEWYGPECLFQAPIATLSSSNHWGGRSPSPVVR
jgi:GNAT superfamily N-acetyltransferase